LYCGTMITALGSYEQVPQVATPTLATDFSLFGMQLNIVQVDAEANRQYTQGVMGPARVIRWDNVASGQSVVVTGSVVVEAVANGNLAPYVSGGTTLTAIDANLLPFTAQLFNSPRESYFHRNYTGEQYVRMVQDFVGNMTAEQVLMIAKEVGAHGAKGAQQYAAGLFGEPLRAIADAGSSLAHGVGSLVSKFSPSDFMQLAETVAPYLADASVCHAPPGPDVADACRTVMMQEIWPQLMQYIKEACRTSVKRKLQIMQADVNDAYSQQHEFVPLSSEERLKRLRPDLRDNSYEPVSMHGAYGAQSGFGGGGGGGGSAMLGADAEFADSDDEQEAQGRLATKPFRGFKMQTGYTRSGRIPTLSAQNDYVHKVPYGEAKMKKLELIKNTYGAAKQIARRGVLIAVDRFTKYWGSQDMRVDTKPAKRAGLADIKRVKLAVMFSGTPFSPHDIIEYVLKNSTATGPDAKKKIKEGSNLSKSNFALHGIEKLRDLSSSQLVFDREDDRLHFLHQFSFPLTDSNMKANSATARETALYKTFAAFAASKGIELSAMLESDYLKDPKHFDSSVPGWKDYDVTPALRVPGQPRATIKDDYQRKAWPPIVVAHTAANVQQWININTYVARTISTAAPVTAARDALTAAMRVAASEFRRGGTVVAKKPLVQTVPIPKTALTQMDAYVQPPVANQPTEGGAYGEEPTDTGAISSGTAPEHLKHAAQAIADDESGEPPMQRPRFDTVTSMVE
jgi:hypothetical protein